MQPFPIETNGHSSAAGCAAELAEVVPAVMRVIRAQMRRRSAEQNLTVVQFRTLAYLNCWAEASLSDVADHIGVTLPSASKMVWTLTSRGYLRKQTHPADRRKSILAPTGKGLRVLAKSRQATRTHLAALIAGMTPRQRTQLCAAMQSLRPIFLADMMPASANETGRDKRRPAGSKRQ